jgi:hypothetical protein
MPETNITIDREQREGLREVGDRPDSPNAGASRRLEVRRRR